MDFVWLVHELYGPYVAGSGKVCESNAKSTDMCREPVFFFLGNIPSGNMSHAQSHPTSTVAVTTAFQASPICSLYGAGNLRILYMILSYLYNIYDIYILYLYI